MIENPSFFSISLEPPMPLFISLLVLFYSLLFLSVSALLLFFSKLLRKPSPKPPWITWKPLLYLKLLDKPLVPMKPPKLVPVIVSPRMLVLILVLMSPGMCLIPCSKFLVILLRTSWNPYLGWILFILYFERKSFRRFFMVGLYLFLRPRFLYKVFQLLRILKNLLLL